MLIIPDRKIWARKIVEQDILECFRNEKSPLDAFIGLHKVSLPWIINKIVINQRGTPLDLLPFQQIILNALWNYKFPMIMLPRGGAKSFLFGLYALMRAMLCPGSQIVIVGGTGFRQSKIIFGYIQKLYYQSPIIQEALKPFGGPKLGSDTAYIDVGRLSIIKAIPLGTDGSSVRGIRATHIICDEFACLDKDTLVETDQGLIRISDFDRLDKSKLFTGDNNLKFEKPTIFNKTPLCNVYEIKLKNGYSIKCSENHQVMTNNGWKTPLEIDSSIDWIESENHYNFPNTQIIINDIKLDKDLAWAIGLLVAEGSVASKNELSISMASKRPLDRLQIILEKYNIKINRYHQDVREDPRGWNCKSQYILKCSNFNFRELLLRFGLERVCAIDKKIPWAILSSPKDIVLSFLEGLYEGDGTCFLFKDKRREYQSIGVTYYSVSERLCRDVQILLTKLGFEPFLGNRNSKISTNPQWFVRLNGHDSPCFGQLLNIDRFNTVINLGIPTKKNKGICWDKSRNQWKVCIVYLGKTLNKRFISLASAQEFLLSLKKFRKINSVNLLTKQDYLYDVYLPQTHSFYADGFRQHNTVPEEIYDTVISPFASVHQDPAEKVRMTEFCNRIRLLGASDEMISTILETRGFGNQIAVGGTASYEFNHFFKQYKFYQTMISSEGDPVKVRQALELKSVTEEGRRATLLHDEVTRMAKTFKQYFIIKIPQEGLPEGFLDQSIVDANRAKFSSVRFGMEYRCFVHDSKIITSGGVKNICDIKINDLVLTHKGRFKKVIKVLEHYYSGPVINYKTYGCNIDYTVTNNHPYWIGGDNWKEIGLIDNNIKLTNLKELSCKENIDLRDYVSNYTERDSKIFPTCSQTKLNNQEIEEIIHSTKSKVLLSQQYNVNLCTIYDVKKKKIAPKTSIPYNISLDYNLGLIIGYYAAEGSIGANGRATTFSLDGHIGENLQYYIKELTDAIFDVFGIKAMIYNQAGNVANITINQRLVADFFKRICPGIAHTKVIDPDILYSNREFMQGIITGYWNGDGHKSLDNSVAKISTSIDLASQIRVTLSYFGIASSLVNVHDKYNVEIHGENAAKFRKLFYDENITFRKSSCYFNNGDSSSFLFRKRINKDYNGLVYNLEVEQDNSYSLLNASVHNCEFAKDSEGFIRRSWIEEATPKNPAHKVELFGNSRFTYVMGLDPARWNDNFGCVILKITPSAWIPVYCTAWNRTDAVMSVKKIREIYNRFIPRYIAMDSGGGGTGIADLLCLKELIKTELDVPIWRIPEQLEDKSVMSAPGPKILDVVNWSSQWIATNAHSLSADISHKRVQFVNDPDLQDVCDQYLRRYPGLETISDAEKNMIETDLMGKEDEDFNKLEEGVWDNLNEMINEICAIERKVTPNGVEQFDLPRLSDQPEGLDVRRRDRFSALVLAAYAARVYSGTGHRPNTAIQLAGTPANILLSSRNRNRARRRGGVVF